MKNIDKENKRYLMESPEEGHRIRLKTNSDETKLHLLTGGIKVGDKAIDVGCASGEATRIMSELVGQQSSVIGFDKSDLRIKESREVDKQRAITNIDYASGSVYNMTDIKDKSFDFVWSRFLLEYLEKPEDAIKEMKRITKENGTLAIADIDGNCIFHYPMSSKFELGLNNVLQVIQKTGFDPFVGRKLFTYFINAGFKQEDIKVSILPYHQIMGTPPDDIFESWKRKINILEQNFKVLAPEKYVDNKWVFNEFLEHIKSSKTMTYSNIFIVSGKKKN